MSASYVYAIVPSDDEVVFDIEGVAGFGDAIYTLPYQGLGAVVGSSPVADYRGLSRSQVAPALVTHQRVIEAIMADYAVLPARFGTVLPDEDWVYRLLRQGHAPFLRAFDELAGRVQMEVVALWALEDIFGEIAQEEPIQQAKERMAACDAQEAQAIAIAVGQMVQASVHHRRMALQERIIGSLSEITPRLIKNGWMDDSMVANVALLTDPAERCALEEQLDMLDNALEGKLTFRCIGPLPPYSFAMLEAEIPAFEDIDTARRLLGLDQTITPGGLRSAYHQIALRLHPDRNKDPDAPTKMEEATRAHQLLSAYLASHMPDGQSPAMAVGAIGHCLTRQAVEEALLITVRDHSSLLR
jgi:hypothetical protein